MAKNKKKSFTKTVVLKKQGPDSRHEIFALVAIHLLAFVLRVQAVIAAKVLPFFKHPVVDAFEYHARAIAISGGELFPPKIPTDPPLYSYLLGTIYSLFGDATSVAYGFNVIIGVATVMPIYLIGRKLGGKQVGLIAALGYALYRPAIIFSAEILTPSLMIAVVSWLLLLLLNEKMPRWQAALAGALGGLAILIRGNALFFAPLAILWLLFKSGRPNKKALVTAAIFAGCTMLVISPQIIVNNMIDPPALAVQDFGGLNIYLGNREGGDGLALSHPGVSGNLLIDAPKYAGIYSFSERNSYFLGRAAEFWSEHPGEALATTVKKIVMVLNGFEYGTGTDHRWFVAENLLLRINPVVFLLILPLALYGYFLLFRQKKYVVALPLLLWVLAIGGSMVIGTVAARYRIAVLPALIAPAGLAVANLLEKIRGRQWRALGPAVAILIAGLFISGPDWFSHSKKQPTDETIARAESARNAGNFSLAEILVTRYLQQHPDDVDARYLRGIYRIGANELTGAMDDLEFVARVEPKFSRIWHDIAVVHMKNEDPSWALAAYQRGIVADPNNVVLLNESAKILVYAGRPGHALDNMRKAVALDNGVELLVNLAQAQAAAGRPREARASLKKALDRVHGSGRIAVAVHDMAKKWNIK
jgi:4-amino-4-deoxy-L-arabinose transferase-like glycosyltransferase